MSSLFGGSGAARRQAEIQRETQRIANDRQLQELNQADQRTPVSRRRPRGRRLFADAARAGLSDKIA